MSVMVVGSFRTFEEPHVHTHCQRPSAGPETGMVRLRPGSTVNMNKKNRCPFTCICLFVCMHAAAPTRHAQ
jgi:hypothetical protein